MNTNTSPRDSNVVEAFASGIFAIAMLGILGWIAWYFWAPYLTWAAVQGVLYTHYLLFPFLPFGDPAYADFIRNVEYYLSRNIDYGNVEFQDFVTLMEIFFEALSVIFVPLFLWRGINNLIYAKQKSFTRVLSLTDVAEIQAKRYPRMRPVAAAKLLEQDHRFGPWATSRNPLPYLIHNRLVHSISDADTRAFDLKPFQTLSETEQLNTLNIYHGKLTFSEADVRTLLVRQIGQRCRYNAKGTIDIDALGPVERAMAIIFLAALTASRENRKTIEDLLDQFGASFKEGGTDDKGAHRPHELNFTGVDTLWATVKDHLKVRQALSVATKQHAYWTTFFTYLFTRVYHEYGTMNARDFSFLKPVNRTLYLLCSQVGLEAARPETGAIRGHFLTECQERHAITQPVVSSACLNLIRHIQREGWLAADLVDDNELEQELAQLTEQCDRDTQEFKRNAAKYGINAR